MEIEEIKDIFFKYNCNISSLLRDNGNINNNVYNTIISNAEVWVKEFLDNYGKIICETDDFLVLAQAFSKCKFACRTYIDFFDLSRILKKVISKEKINVDGLFIYYYELIIMNIKLTQNDSSCLLIDYMREFDFDNYQVLITDIKEVLKKDNNLSSDYCQRLKTKIKNMISE